MTSISSVEFNRDTGKARQMAEKEPVFIVDRGAASHVLISIGDYQKLTSQGKTLSDKPSMANDIDFEPPKIDDAEFRPVEFD
jgi:PHD/YefM family antitoxin component YafN of YafNO toxin-antitoxin module